MATKKKSKGTKVKAGSIEQQRQADRLFTPPGTTKKASDRTARPGGPPPSRLGDRHAAGTPAGGTEVGGLAGTNVGDGDPENADLNEAMAGALDEAELEIEQDG